MKRILLFIFTLAILILPFKQAMAVSPPTIDLFYSPTCPHCKEEISFLGTLENKYPNLIINKHNVFQSNTTEVLKTFFEKYKVPAFKQGQVPITFINDEYYVGFNNIIGNDIENQIKKAEKKIDNQTATPTTDVSATKTLKLPLLGNINLSEHSPLFLSIFIGTLDGFNACAMVALGFLLAVLIATKMRKRLLLVGGTFILVSGLVYFLFISAWLNLFMFLGQAMWINIVVSAITIMFALFILKDYIKGIVCKICNIDPNSKNPLDKWQKKLFTAMSRITSSNMPLPLMLLGVAVVAAGINTVELFCSFGFPLAFTSYLTSLGLSTSSYYFYLIIYVVFYMIDDFIIFLVALATLRVTKMSDKYLRFIMLISGIVLLLLGIFMISRVF